MDTVTKKIYAEIALNNARITNSRSEWLAKSTKKSDYFVSADASGKVTVTQIKKVWH